MHSKFVRTSNVVRALEGYAEVRERGAREAGWLVIIGEPGLSKTRFLSYLATHTSGVLLRAKPDWTTQWLHEEVCEQFSLPATGSKKQMLAQIIDKLIAQPVPIIVDEVENTRHNYRLLEVIRLIADEAEVEVVLGGTDVVLGFINRHKQIASRVFKTVPFKVASREDVRLMCDQLSEVKIADDLVDRLLADSNGYLREIKNGIGRVEAIGKINPGKVIGASDVAATQLCTNRQALDPGGRGRR